MSKSFLEKRFSFVNLFLKSFSKSFDMPRLKWLSDFTFVILEKIAVGLDKLFPFYLSFYDNMISNEIQMANISSKNNILHIGGGSIPATSIILNKKINSKITCIDNDLKSVQNAQSLLSKLNKTEDILIIHANGVDFSVKDYDLIIISDGIKVLDKILKNISKSMSKNTKIIIRKSIKNPKMYAIGKPCPDANIFTVKDMVSQVAYGKLSSILLESNT